MKSRILIIVTAIMIVLAVSASMPAFPGAFLFAESNNNPDIITHPSGYTGSQDPLQVEVCIDPGSGSISEMTLSVENAIRTWNRLQPTTENLLFGGDNNIPSGELDFESTLLHELGHCIGLAHPNLATESGQSEPERNFTKTTTGANGSYDLDDGADNIIGSSDDVRGDDVNLHWFWINENNPFAVPAVIDGSTYSTNLADLPIGDSFAANADRNVATTYGFSDTEAVMQQGAFFDEDQRQLNHDDVATIRLAASGLDETQGTGDDYTLELIFGGVASGCDIMVESTGTSFAFCTVGGAGISGSHVRVTTGSITLGSASNFDWFFNDVSNEDADLIFADSFES